MTLLYVALSYLAGILSGHYLWQVGIIDCGTPTWLWWASLASLPVALWWEHRTPAAVQEPMRWPSSAGFVPPRPAFSRTLILLLGLALATGVLRYASQPFAPCLTPDHLAFYNAKATGNVKPVTVSGYVNSYPLVKGNDQSIIIRTTAIRLEEGTYSADGLLRLKIRRLSRLSYGQPVQVTGVLKEPPVFEDFDYRAYLASKGVHSVMDRPQLEALPGALEGHRALRMIYEVRSRGEKLLQRLMPEPYAALANGMLLGIESAIPDELYEAFNRTGASHVIVISGSNVALLSGVILAVGVRLLGRRRALWPTLVGIACYAILVGGDASVTRAALMGGLFVTASAIDRQSTALVSLGVACWLMTLLNPLTLWDAGFQLSAAATAGLILFSPIFTSALDKLTPGMGQAGHLTGGLSTSGHNLLRGLIADGVLMTLAATLTTMPLLLLHFGRMSVVSLVTNLLIVPVQPFILLWGSLGVVIGLVGLTLLAQLVLWVPYLCLAWTVAMVHWTDSWPGGSLTVANFGSGAFILSYLLLALLRWWTWTKERLKRLWKSLFALVARRSSPAQREGGPFVASHLVGNTMLAVLGVASILVWWVNLTQPDGYLHVHFLNVGQGDGIFIQTPSGRQVLVDGGSDPQVLFNELGAAMPFWDRSIDVLLLTHPDFDHMGAQLAVPERYNIAQAVVSAVTITNKDGQAWKDIVTTASIPVVAQSAGGWIDLGDGVALWFLWPSDEPAMKRSNVDVNDKNEHSLVAMLVYGELRLLLTGDAGLPAERAMIHTGAPLAAQILKVGHHGSNSSTGTDFVTEVNPSIAVVQVGQNRYGHPTQEVLDALSGRIILRNDLHGRIHMWSDGQHLWVDADKQISLHVAE
jgi:competence protein ComEC